MADPMQGAVGLPIVYQVQDKDGNPRDISTFTTHELVFQRPDKTVIVKPADFVSDGSDGQLQYTTVDGDLDLYGSFQTQAHLVKVGIEEYTEPAIFHVARNLPR